jgi:hypothetical protein
MSINEVVLSRAKINQNIKRKNMNKPDEEVKIDRGLLARSNSRSPNTTSEDIMQPINRVEKYVMAIQKQREIANGNG